MKNSVLWVIMGIALVYFIKKGHESAEQEGEELNFLQTIKRGFDLTVQSSKAKQEQNPDPGMMSSFEWSGQRPDNSEMFSATPARVQNSFHGLKRKKVRGMFHRSALYSSPSEN